MKITMNTKNTFKNLIISTALVTVAFAPNTSFSAPVPEEKNISQSSSSDTYKLLNMFGDVFERTRSNYVDKVEDKKLIEYALNGMLSSLDPHSGYMNEEEANNMNIQNKGEFGGLGIEVTMESGVVKVVSPIDDTPASKAGIESGDMIVEIDNKPVMGMTLSDAVDKMRGKVGTEINLSVIRKGAKEPLKFKLVRDIIKVQSVKNQVFRNNVGYIRITTFNEQTFPGLRKAFKEIQQQTGDKLAGYIIDLRNNPGGLLEQAIAVSDAFIDKGEIVSTRGRNEGDTRRDMATPGDLTNGLPVVVIINGGSASASEIVAGALQDHKRAIIIGTKSFGKGSVQTLFNVAGGGMIRLTTARYYTPSGRSIQAKGIEPDMVVEQAKLVEEKQAFADVHEADLKGALENPDDALEAYKKKTATKEESKDADAAKKLKDEDDKVKNDYQLSRAIGLVQGISIYRENIGAKAPAAPAKADKATKEEAPKKQEK